MEKENVNESLTDSNLKTLLTQFNPYLSFLTNSSKSTKANALNSEWFSKQNMKLRHSAYIWAFGNLKDCGKTSLQYVPILEFMQQLIPALEQDVAHIDINSQDTALLRNSALKLIGLYLNKCTSDTNLSAKQLHSLLERIKDLALIGNGDTAESKEILTLCAWLVGTQNLQAKQSTREFGTLLDLTISITGKVGDSTSTAFELLNALQKLATQKLELFSSSSKKWLEFALNCLVHSKSEAVAKKARVFLESFIKALAISQPSNAASVSLATKQFAKGSLVEWLSAVRSNAAPYANEIQQISCWRIVVCLFGADLKFPSRNFDTLVGFIEPHLYAKKISTKRVALHAWALLSNACAVPSAIENTSRQHLETEKLIKILLKPVLVAAATSTSSVIFNLSIAVWMFIGSCMFTGNDYTGFDVFFASMLDVLVQSQRPEAAELAEQAFNLLFIQNKSALQALRPSALTSSAKAKRLQNLTTTIDELGELHISASLAFSLQFNGNITPANSAFYLKALCPKLISLIVKWGFKEAVCASRFSSSIKIASLKASNWWQLFLQSLSNHFKRVVNFKAEIAGHLPGIVKAVQLAVILNTVSVSSGHPTAAYEAARLFCLHLFHSLNKEFSTEKVNYLAQTCKTLALGKIAEVTGEQSPRILDLNYDHIIQSMPDFGVQYLSLVQLLSSLSCGDAPDAQSYATAIKSAGFTVGSNRMLVFAAAAHQVYDSISLSDSARFEHLKKLPLVLGAVLLNLFPAANSENSCLDLAVLLSLLLSPLADFENRLRRQTALKTVESACVLLANSPSAEKLITLAISPRTFASSEVFILAVDVLAVFARFPAIAQQKWFNDCTVRYLDKLVSTDTVDPKDIITSLVDIAIGIPIEYLEKWSSLLALLGIDYVELGAVPEFRATVSKLLKRDCIQRLLNESRGDSFWDELNRCTNQASALARTADAQSAVLARKSERSQKDYETADTLLQSPLARRAFSYPQTSSPPSSILKKRSAEFGIASGSSLESSNSKRRKSVTFDMTCIDQLVPSAAIPHEKLVEAIALLERVKLNLGIDSRPFSLRSDALDTAYQLSRLVYERLEDYKNM